MTKISETVKRKVLKPILKKLSGFGKTLCTAYEKLKAGQDKAEALKALYFGETYKKTIRYAKHAVWRVLREVLPKKAGGTITAGMDDPYTTGMIMQGAAFLYPLYGDALKVNADFECSRIDAELHAKGRIHLIVLVYYAARLFFDRKVRRLYKKTRKICGIS